MMEDKTKEEALDKRSGELIKGITGKDAQEVPAVSAIDEVRKLNRETKELKEEIKSLAEKFEATASEILLGGRSIAGQKPKELTEEDKINLKADEVLNRFKV